jgi:hypothetical protein
VFNHFWQVFGLAGCLMAPASSRGVIPDLLSGWNTFAASASIGVFVPAYRCGAVPEVRRIPFSGERLKPTTRSKI